MQSENNSTKPAPNRLSRWLLFVAAAGVGLTIFGIAGLRKEHTTTHNPHPQVSSEPVTTSTDEPDETPLECTKPDTSTGRPYRIVLPSVSASGCIEPVGIDQHKAVAVPTNIHFAGWYVDSVLPGESGVSLIDGHVHGKYLPGIFSKLHLLKPGDQFTISFDDGSASTFQVVTTDLLTVKETTQAMLRNTDDISNQLNLITCGGTYDRKTRAYDKRVLVTSRLVVR